MIIFWGECIKNSSIRSKHVHCCMHVWHEAAAVQQRRCPQLSCSLAVSAAVLLKTNKIQSSTEKQLCHHRPQTKAHSNEYQNNTHKAEQALPAWRGAGRSSRGEAAAVQQRRCPQLSYSLAVSAAAIFIDGTFNTFMSRVVYNTYVYILFERSEFLIPTCVTPLYRATSKKKNL